MTALRKGTVVFTVPVSGTFLQLLGKAAAFFIEILECHFFLRKRQCLGTPNNMDCQQNYQAGSANISQIVLKKMTVTIDILGHRMHIVTIALPHDSILK